MKIKDGGSQKNTTPADPYGFSMSNFIVLPLILAATQSNTKTVAMTHFNTAHKEFSNGVSTKLLS